MSTESTFLRFYLFKKNQRHPDCIARFHLQKIYKDSWLNVSTTLKSITTEIAEIRDKVDSDLKVINADTSPYAF